MDEGGLSIWGLGHGIRWSIIGESPLSTMAPRFVRDGIPVFRKRGMESKDLVKKNSEHAALIRMEKLHNKNHQ